MMDEALCDHIEDCLSNIKHLLFTDLDLRLLLLFLLTIVLRFVFSFIVLLLLLWRLLFSVFLARNSILVLIL